MNNKIGEPGLKEAIGKLSLASCISILGYNKLGEELCAQYYDQMTAAKPTPSPVYSKGAGIKDKSLDDPSSFPQPPITTSFDAIKAVAFEKEKLKISTPGHSDQKLQNGH